MSDLEHQTALKVQNGWRVESQTPRMVSLVSGKPVNHVLHLILSLVTLGLWIPVWIIMGLAGGERRCELLAADDGTVTVTRTHR